MPNTTMLRLVTHPLRLLAIVGTLAACEATRPSRPLEPASPAVPPAAPSRLAGTEFEFTIEKAIQYKKHPRIPALRLDLYRPECAGPHPTVAVFPGGAWKFGNRHHPDATTLARALAREGIAAASVSYRRTAQAPHPAQIEDCRSAFHFLRDNAQRFDLDASRIGVMGASAGGHLAALLGATETPDSRPRCVVGLCAPLDFGRNDEEEVTGLQLSLLSDLFGLDKSRADELGVEGFLDELHNRAVEASPIHFVDSGDPPFLLVHGAQDTIVPVGHSRRMHAKLIEAGVRCDYVEVPDSGHIGFFVRANPAEWRDQPPRFWNAIKLFLAEELL